MKRDTRSDEIRGIGERSRALPFRACREELPACIGESFGAEVAAGWQGVRYKSSEEDHDSLLVEPRLRG
jgi:hypothetical protein